MVIIVTSKLVSHSSLLIGRAVAWVRNMDILHFVTSFSDLNTAIPLRCPFHAWVRNVDAESLRYCDGSWVSAPAAAGGNFAICQ